MSRLRLTAFFGMAFLVMAVASAQEKKDPPKVDPKKVDEKKTDLKVDDKKGPVTPPVAGDNELSWKFTKDVPFYQKLTTKTVQNIKVQGLDVGQTQEQTFMFKFNPVRQDGDKWIVKQMIEGVIMKIDIAGNPVSYDSTNEGSTANANTALADFFKAIKGSEFTLTIAKDMTVEKVEGRDEFVKKLGAANKQLEPLLNKILSDEAMKQMADPTFGVVPKEKKKIGEKWDKAIVLNLGPIGSYNNTYSYTYKKLEGDVAEIDAAVSLVYKAPGAENPGEQLPFKIKSAEFSKDPQGKDMAGGKGTIKFNTKIGRIDSSNVKIDMTGKLTLEIAGSTTTVDLNQSQETTISFADKSFVPEPKK